MRGVCTNGMVVSIFAIMLLHLGGCGSSPAGQITSALAYEIAGMAAAGDCEIAPSAGPSCEDKSEAAELLMKSTVKSVSPEDAFPDKDELEDDFDAHMERRN